MADVRTFRLVQAQIMVAFSLLLQQTASGVPLAAEVRAQALRITEHACQLAGSDPFVLSRAAHLLSYCGRNYERGETLIEHAIALNPNDAAAWNVRGWISVMCVEPARAIESFERQFRLSPLEPRRAGTLNGIAFAHYHAGAYGQGRDIAAKALELGVDAHTLCALIVNEVALGHLEEARASASRLPQVRRDFRAADSRWIFPMRVVEVADRIAAALRASGVPE
jgi:tetratricopeptide (TPR) repeat protein